MKKFAIITMVMLMMLSLTAAAFAGGPPPKNVKKGVALEVNAAEGTVLFEDSATHETSILMLTDMVRAEDIKINKKLMVSFEKHDGKVFIKTAEVMFMDLTLTKFFSLILVGLVGGLLSGFIGSGGAFVLTPAMMSLGAPGAIAVASNMCHKFPKAMVGAIKRYKYGQVDIKLGLVMAVSAIVGVQIGIQIQKAILNAWGNAGSNLYVSVVFVVVLVIVGAYVLKDAFSLSKKTEKEQNEVPKLALRLQKLNIPPMMHFKTAGITISAWITLPIGLATGMLAATIAVGGFIGVPGMIYALGATAIVASATELVVAFIMGTYGSIQWAMSGLVDIRMTLLILSASLIGVQLGAIGTTYVKDYAIKLVMAATMLIVAVSRGAKIPVYLQDLGWTTISHSMRNILNGISFWALIAALATAGIIITGAMVKGMREAKKEELQVAESHS